VNDLNYPAKVEPGQGFDINTLLTVTCNEASVAVTGRVDVFDNSTGQLLSISGFPVGTNPNSPEWSITASVSSRIQAPATKGVFHLRMMIWLSIGEGVPALRAGELETSFQVLVGEATPESYTTLLIIGQGTSATLTFVYISSNTSVTNTVYDSGSHVIAYSSSGPTGANGFTAVLLPKYVIDGSPVVLIDNGNLNPVSLSVSGNATHYLVAFGYPLSDHTVVIGGSSTIPEFGILSLPLTVSVVVSVAAIGFLRRARRRLRRRAQSV
jgi:hypothetical protein